MSPLLLADKTKEGCTTVSRLKMGGEPFIHSPTSSSSTSSSSPSTLHSSKILIAKTVTLDSSPCDSEEENSHHADKYSDEKLRIVVVQSIFKYHWKSNKESTDSRKEKVYQIPCEGETNYIHFRCRDFAFCSIHLIIAPSLACLRFLVNVCPRRMWRFTCGLDSLVKEWIIFWNPWSRLFNRERTFNCIQRIKV